MWSYDKFEGKPLELRRWIRERTQWMKWGDATGKAMRHLLDGGGSDDEAAASRDDILGQDVDLNMPDGQLAEFVRRQFADSRGMPPTQGRAPRAQGGRDKLPAFSKSDTTCHSCL